jgi:O-antigen/teichoic acid export membrane protein
MKIDHNFASKPLEEALAEDVSVERGLESTRQRRPEDHSFFERTTSALGWRFVAESGRLGLQVLVMIILARLLPVEAFGVITLAMIVVNLAQQIPGLGTGPALIQKPEISPVRIRVAFTLSMLSGLVLTAAIWVGAPLAASVFHSDAVTPVLQLLSFAFLFTSLGATSGALLERQLNYRKLLKVELVSYGLGFAVTSLVLALLNYGVWAMAWGTVACAALRALLLLAASPHAMRPSLCPAEARQLLNFGLGTTLTRLANYAAMNGDYFVVGRYLGTVALGLYSRAYQVMTLPMYQFSMVVSSVLFPAYAQIQHDAALLRRAYLNSLALSAIVVFPLLTGMAIVAPELMTGVFGPQWAAAGLPLQILCVGGVFQCMYKPADCLARAKGAVYLQFCCHSLYTLCVIGGSLLGSFWGITGVAVGVVGALGVIYLLTTAVSLRLLQVGWWSGFFLMQLPGAILAMAVAALTLPITLLLRAAQVPPLAILAAGIAASSLAVVAAAVLLPRSWMNKEAFGALLSILQQYRAALKLKAKSVLRYNQAAYKMAEVLYENGLYLPHIIRQGLWRTATGLRLPHARVERQTAMVWDVGLPPCQEAGELIDWLRARGIEVHEGGHTIYLPPQEQLRHLIPSVVAFYPPTAGFKILKDFRCPSQARYLRLNYRHVPLLTNMIGTPGEQLLTANYLYFHKIGPRIWDLTCWRTQDKNYTVFVLDHVEGVEPTVDQCHEFLSLLKKVLATSYLRVLIPQWEENMDFMPPRCNGNLVYSQALRSLQYVDFQNFGLTKRNGWSREILADDKVLLHFGNGAPSRRAGLNHSTVSSGTTAHRNTDHCWPRLLSGLHDAGVDLHGRLVLDLGCDAGTILRHSLAEGAAWGIGWDQPAVVNRSRELLLSLGLTRFSLISVEMNSTYSLQDDIPVHLHDRLSQSVIFCLSVRQNVGFLNSIRDMPWRALVYEGHEGESLESAQAFLKPSLAGRLQIASAFDAANENARSRPVVILTRE